MTKSTEIAAFWQGSFYSCPAWVAKCDRIWYNITIKIVDVRTQSEYDEGHIQNAVLIPNETIGSEPPANLPDKNAIILVYCRSGRRSEEAARKLVNLGYVIIYDFGGINDWTYGTVKD